MHSIFEVCKQTGLTTEDIRLFLMDVRQDWETCEYVSDSEYQLIISSCQAKLNGDTSITPVNSMLLENQQKIVQNASQVLNHTLMLSIAEEVALIDAIDQIKNQIILSNHSNRKRELAQALSADWRSAKISYLDAMRTLAEHVLPKVEVEPDTIDAATEINNIRTELGKLLTK